VYFAASVIWRAAARTWTFLDYRDSLSLGPYFEDFRIYLLGERGFPDRAAVCLNVWTDPAEVSVLPRTLAAEGYRQHNFSIPWITFRLYVGQHIPNEIRSACAAHSPERMILLSSQMNARMMNGIAHQVKSTRATGNLRRRD
jgi:hypothetical protein